MSAEYIYKPKTLESWRVILRRFFHS